MKRRRKKMKIGHQWLDTPGCLLLLLQWSFPAEICEGAEFERVGVLASVA